jgi:hypothetical protein
MNEKQVGLMQHCAVFCKRWYDINIDLNLVKRGIEVLNKKLALDGYVIPDPLIVAVAVLIMVDHKKIFVALARWVCALRIWPMAFVMSEESCAMAHARRLITEALHLFYPPVRVHVTHK